MWPCSSDPPLLALDLLPPEVCSLLNPAAIYANNEISLRDVEVYGFDYDYTLAQYSDALHPQIFNAARDILIEHYKVRLSGHRSRPRRPAGGHCLADSCGGATH